MQKITIGRLIISCSENTYIFPSESSENATQKYTAELRVVKDMFWVRIYAMGDLGFAEAYMYGDVDCDDLISLFRVSCPWMAYIKFWQSLPWEDISWKSGEPQERHGLEILGSFFPSPKDNWLRVFEYDRQRAVQYFRALRHF